MYVRPPYRPWGWWGPSYRRPYHRSYWPYLGYYDQVYAPYPVAPAGYATASPGRIGVGLAVSHFDGGGDLADGSGLAGSLRWRGDRIGLEVELAGQHHRDDDRRDRRFGGNLYLDLAHHRSVTPYLVGGLGVNRVERDAGADVQQGYLAGGAGLAFPLGASVTLSGDVRWHARWALDEHHDRPTVRATGTTDPGDDDERLLEARLGLMIYF